MRQQLPEAERILVDDGSPDAMTEEIEDVGKSEQRELASRMALLLSHLMSTGCQDEAIHHPSR